MQKYMTVHDWIDCTLRNLLMLIITYTHIHMLYSRKGRNFTPQTDRFPLYPGSIKDKFHYTHTYIYTVKTCLQHNISAVLGMQCKKPHKTASNTRKLSSDKTQSKYKITMENNRFDVHCLFSHNFVQFCTFNLLFRYISDPHLPLSTLSSFMIISWRVKQSKDFYFFLQL